MDEFFGVSISPSIAAHTDRLRSVTATMSAQSAAAQQLLSAALVTVRQPAPKPAAGVAGEQLGLSRDQVYRLRRSEPYRRERERILQQLDEIKLDVVVELLEAAPRAVRRLKELLASDDPRISRRVALDLLDRVGIRRKPRPTAPPADPTTA